MRTGVQFLAAVVLGIAFAGAVQAQPHGGKVDPDGMTPEAVRQMLQEYYHPTGVNDRVGPLDIPDVFGPGAVLDVGNVFMKVTNWGHVGNLFTNISSDPAGQWPGASGISYLSSVRLAVAAVNPTATDPAAIRRVSYLQEWRPQTLEPEDKMYRAYDGIVNGGRFVNDDGDQDPPGTCGTLSCPKIDEDFLDGRDNDGDGLIDEDHAALGQELYSCVIWDNTIQAINTVFNEKHVPFGLETRQKSWAYSIVGFQDFNVVEWEIFNRSGHVLDSVFVGGLVDMDAGPEELSNFFSDDFEIPYFPQGEFIVKVGGDPGDIPDPLRAQEEHANVPGISADSALCPRQPIRINGFSLVDDNGDEDRTTGIASFLLISHSVDPLGESGPPRVGFRAFRGFTAGTPFTQGGFPTIDQQRFEFMSSAEHINQETGFIDVLPGDQKGDYLHYWSVGPWRNMADGASISVTVAFAVALGSYVEVQNYTTDYQRYTLGSLTPGELLQKYPALENALSAQIAYEGVHEVREGFLTPDFHGRETGRIVPRNTPPVYLADCRDAEGGNLRPVTDLEYTWFDFDCNYCTGVWDAERGEGDPRAGGLFHKTWNAEAPPPNPILNTVAAYNFTDNPDRIAPGQDNSVVLAWDNLSEITPDPKSQWFDFRGYKLWKVSDWTRPVGSPGPSEEDWTLIGEFRLFDYEANRQPILNNLVRDTLTGQLKCPEVFIPNWLDPATGVRGPAKVPICLERGDLWDRQSGEVIKPDLAMDCARDEFGDCIKVDGCIVGRNPCTEPLNRELRNRYPIGRYRYVDREVKNGFLYFYSITAFDSTTELGRTTELSGRRSAVEAEGVVPQAASSQGRNVWVVPNPYRGYSRIADRPSAWDLTPNATDPTGTHIDFMGLPRSKYTIRIYTVSGDLVQVIQSTDAVNESVRPIVSLPNGSVVPGYNRQQDHPNDGQARWNLISRNGQDVVSGIYIFTVESDEGIQRGRFVVIR